MSCHCSQLLAPARMQWLANQGIFNHTSPTAKQTLSTRSGLGLIHCSTRHFSPSAASLMGGDSQQMGRSESWLVTTTLISTLSNWPRRNATVQMYVNRLFLPDLCQPFQTCANCRNTPQMHHHSNSGLLLLGYNLP